MTNQIKVGDKVENIDGTWSTPSTVKSIIPNHPKMSEGNPIAIFEEGGFWRISKLRKVS